MKLDHFLEALNVTQYGAVRFRIDRATGAIGDTSRDFLSPLQCVCREKIGGVLDEDLRCAEILDIAPDLAQQIIMVSDGDGQGSYLRRRILEACGLGEPSRSNTSTF